MSKMQVAIIDVLSNSSDWMTSTEIAKATGFQRPSTRVTLVSMIRNGLVVKKDDPLIQHGALYRKSDVSSGFGVSNKIAQFDECLRGVRQ